MKNALEYLDEVRQQALHDDSFRKRILETLRTDKPVASFCSLCNEELGLSLETMDLVGAGEAWYTEMIRGRNGGGENSPLIFGEEDPYTMLILELQELEKKDH